MKQSQSIFQIYTQVCRKYWYIILLSCIFPICLVPYFLLGVAYLVEGTYTEDRFEILFFLMNWVAIFFVVTFPLLFVSYKISKRMIQTFRIGTAWKFFLFVGVHILLVMFAFVITLFLFFVMIGVFD